MPRPHQYSVAFDREDDGRVIAELPGLPEVLPVYGATRPEARRRLVAAALFHLAAEMEAGAVDISSVTFRAA